MNYTDNFIEIYIVFTPNINIFDSSTKKETNIKIF